MNATALPLAGILTIACSEARGQPTSYADEWLGQAVDDATFQNYLEFFVVDHEQPLDAELLDSRENDGVRREEWSFTSTPGERVYGHYFETVTAPSSARSAILYVGPFSQRALESFARGGFDVLAFDMKYWGRRETGLFTTFTENDKQDPLYNRSPLYLDWMIQTVKDVQRSYDFLVTEKNVAPGRIALMGFSRRHHRRRRGEAIRQRDSLLRRAFRRQGARASSRCVSGELRWAHLTRPYVGHQRS